VPIWKERACQRDEAESKRNQEPGREMKPGAIRV
jgi:hypothetical protein